MGAVVIVALAACTTGIPDVIERPYVSHNYSRSLIVGANQYETTKLEVTGRTFDAPADRLDKAVLDAISDVGLLSTIPLTTGNADERNPYRLIVQFAPDPGLSHRGVCEGNRRSLEASDGDVSFMMTYCLGRKPITSLRARQQGISGLDDPAFAKLLRNAATVAFSPSHEALRKGADGNDVDE
jgi:hypothetical protein